MTQIPLDALPVAGDTQVLILSRWERSPDLIEQQVTSPIVNALLGAPRIRTVRGLSEFGYSLVYVIFEESTDPYWARSRTAEYLASVESTLPPGVRPELGPDSTGVGWVFQYVVEDPTHKHDLVALRSIQDWYLRYHLRSVPGVSDVASIGGSVKQYQVNVFPDRLRALGIPIGKVVSAVRSGNSESTGRVIEMAGAEYVVRGNGYFRSLADIEDCVVDRTQAGPIVRVKDVASVTLGPDLRRGLVELNGQGETVSGIVIIRQGHNALEVIRGVKAKLEEIKGGLPAGVSVRPIYDRSELIESALRSLARTLLEIAITVALVVFVVLRHLPSAIIPVITIPVAILLSAVVFKQMGLTADIMSLGGIALAVGAMIDASIVVVEQTHQRLEVAAANGTQGGAHRAILTGIQQVAGPSFMAMLVIALSVVPLLTLDGEEGQLFRPLIYTKTICMLVGALLAITFDPALRIVLTQWSLPTTCPSWLSRPFHIVSPGRVQSQLTNPITRLSMRCYEPAVWWALRNKRMVYFTTVALMIVTIPVFLALDTEVMPPLDEGTLLYMPTTLPGIAIGPASELLAKTDRVIKQFPEVDQVLGKAGRADTPTDPAPLSMFETIVTLKSKEHWRTIPTWYSGKVPPWTLPFFRRITPDTLSTEQLIDQLNTALTIPGVANTWTMPIKGRMAMLSTGIKTDIGIKITGSDSKIIERIGQQLESVLKGIPGTRSALSERTTIGFAVDVDWNRENLARQGLTMDDAQETIHTSIGGDTIAYFYEGRERYPINVRYHRDFRSSIDSIERALVSLPDGRNQVPLSDVASVSTRETDSMLRNERGLLTGYVYVDTADVDQKNYLDNAIAQVRRTIDLPSGYNLVWTGRWERWEHIKHKLQVLVPITLLCVFVLIYSSTSSLSNTCLILLSVPFSAIGATWLVYLLGYKTSLCVWVGGLALLGLAAETGMFMLLYLEIEVREAQMAGSLNTMEDLRRAIVNGAAKRLRPKLMTIASACIGLVPILWSIDAGAEILKRIAAPMIGGLITSFLLELLVYPAVYEQLRQKDIQMPSAQLTTGTAIAPL